MSTNQEAQVLLEVLAVLRDGNQKFRVSALLGDQTLHVDTKFYALRSLLNASNGG